MIQKVVFFSILLVLCSGAALSKEPPDKLGIDPQTYDIILKIKQKEASLKTFSARFDQIQKSSLFEQVVKSSGVILYDAKGKLLFRINQPDPLVVFFDGQWVLVHDPKANRTKRRNIGQQENLLRKFFGIGQTLEELTSRFDIMARSNAPLTGVSLQMRPKKGSLARHVQLVSAVVDSKTWLPLEIFIQQNNDDWARLFLTFTSTNKPLPEKLFSLDSLGEPDFGH